MSTPRAVVTAAVVAALAFGGTMLYLTYGRPPAEPTEVVVDRPFPPANGLAVATGAIGDAGASATIGTPTVVDNASSAEMDPATARPATAGLQRPGTEAIERLDLSLDGSTAGQIAVTSRYTVTAGCQPLYADVFGVRGGRWQRLFDATDPGMAYGPLLPQPESTSAGCFPKIRLFSGRTVAGEDALLIFGIAYADTSLRVQVLGWDKDARAPAALFDWRTGPNGSVFRSPDGDRLEIAEDAPASDAAGSPGRFTQVVSLAGGTVAVASRGLAPNCDRGHMSGWQTGVDGSPPEHFVLACSSGSTVTAATGGAVLQPEDAGIGWSDVQDGDSVQLQYDRASLAPASLTEAVPRVTTITDYAAATRHREAERANRPTRTATRPPTRPTTSSQTAPRQPVSQPRAPVVEPGSSSEGAAPRAAPPPAQQSEPASVPTRPGVPANSGPASRPARQPAQSRPVATAPAPVASPPAAPRGLPINGPPPAPR